MEGKARFVFPVVITAIIVFVVSGAVTFFNIGWWNGFVIRWWSAFAIGWPIACAACRSATRWIGRLNCARNGPDVMLVWKITEMASLSGHAGV
jgi:hypothetical protein